MLQISHKSKKYKWPHNLLTWSHRQFFWRYFIFLVKFSNWSKFHVNIIAGSGVETVFFYNGLTRNTEIVNTPVWVLANIWRLGRVRDTKFGTNVSNKVLLNTAKCQGYSFYRFWVSKRKPTGGKTTRPPPPPFPPPRLGLKLGNLICAHADFAKFIYKILNICSQHKKNKVTYIFRKIRIS